MSTLEKALATASQAHAGRIGEDGEAEVLHPIRVMLRLSDDEERQTALLHDTIEDGGMTAIELRAAGFSERIIEAVETLTGRPNETYDDYIRRVLLVPLAARVKRADVEEHASVVAQMPVNAEQQERMGNYERARIALSQA
ncbi:guanosine-3',5'-bis(diphosphate) 3'-pyrophosphohydrolase [Undibacterium fentianense]|uniref:Guanosine-3',5'-bis(Diphosphate) 3'-pyrophosphohydrolase n=1 Tax=Undibacterium fentianense TaxID=2828728 RepID=A0A941E1C1_9BURK|nr:guanosine-3',5'-bis(diphosphate) 3'-pyrophosphohydrolase [Undibacterium fentianense]MBR7801429.1 guanosine-3',5'-bis(diphosphate) 3'-pyrophosphohydrolase [Undibacterium fentianense]